jgi:endonuclease/exonuclease/phosphatase family metal-dependent hydrolase
VRIVSYNILNGGEGRADPLAEVILGRDPDVVCLVEADDAAVLDRISMRLKMDYVVTSTGRHRAALMSRWPIVQSVDHGLLRDGFSGSLLEAIIAQPDESEWPVGVIHLSPKATEAAEQTREAEIAIALDVFAGYRSTGRPHLLAGDFNSNSPIQSIDPSACKTATRAAWKENGGDLPRRVVQRLLDAGYVDSLYALNPHYAIRAGSFTTQEPGQRVDYIFSFGIDHSRDAWIEQDRLARYASDHFPVGLEI